MAEKHNKGGRKICHFDIPILPELPIFTFYGNLGNMGNLENAIMTVLTLAHHLLLSVSAKSTLRLE